MEQISLSLILDGVILVLLMATIIYAARLALYLKTFKESRADLEIIIRNLSEHIDKADHSVSTLNRTVDELGEELQERIKRARSMYEELEMVVESADSMANRLEDLAIRNRKILDGGESDLADLQKITKESDYHEDEKQEMSFMIRDPEMEMGHSESSDGFTLDDNEVLSDAERDLYEALQRRKNAKGGV